MALCAMGTPVYTWAQAVPPSGQILKNTENSLPTQALTSPQGANIEVPQAPAATPESMNERVEVSGYRFTGNTVFDEKTLAGVIGSPTGALTLAQLNERADALTQYYRRHGYVVARVYVPAQQIKDGVVTFAVLEGRYDKIAVAGRSRISSDRALRIMNHAACSKASCPGGLIEREGLERGLLLLNDTPGVRGTAKLSPGDQTGTSTLDIDTEATPWVAGSVMLDNGGNYYTGVLRGIGNLWLNSPLGIGDQASVQGVASTIHGRMNYAALGYSLPIGYSGLRFGVRAWNMNYKLGDVYRVLDRYGTIYGGEATVHYPILRSQSANVYASVSGGTLHFRDHTDALNMSDWRTIRGHWNLNLSGDVLDHLLQSRPALNTYSLEASGGDLKLDAVLAAFDSATTRSTGRYHKLVLNYTRLQQITAKGALYLRVMGQHASKNLDAYEKWSLGGPDAVRAYPVGESLVDKGVLYTVEWRQQLMQLLGGPLDGTLFYDHASGKLNVSPWTRTVSNSAVLHGAGIGLNWTLPRNLALRSYVAFRGPRAWRAAPNQSLAYYVALSAAF